VTDVSIRIKYVEQPPEAYTRQELEDLFRVSSEDDKLLWRFFLGTGMREAEVSVGEHPDINAEKKTISIVEESYFGFKPKDCEKRVVLGQVWNARHPRWSARAGFAGRTEPLAGT
jgi:hypothetical protein